MWRLNNVQLENKTNYGSIMKSKKKSENTPKQMKMEIQHSSSKKEFIAIYVFLNKQEKSQTTCQKNKKKNQKSPEGRKQ